jgi:hypothetical protein
MSSSSRRNFLVLSGAAVSTTVIAPSVLTRSAAAETPMSGGARAAGPMVAYVEDASSGEVLLMLGERQMVVRDAELVARLSGHLG